MSLRLFECQQSMLRCERSADREALGGGVGAVRGGGTTGVGAKGAAVSSSPGVKAVPMYRVHSAPVGALGPPLGKPRLGSTTPLTHAASICCSSSSRSADGGSSSGSGLDAGAPESTDAMDVDATTAAEAQAAAVAQAAATASDCEHLVLRARLSELEKELSAGRSKEEALVAKCAEFAAGNGSNKVTNLAFLAPPWSLGSPSYTLFHPLIHSYVLRANFPLPGELGSA